MKNKYNYLRKFRFPDFSTMTSDEQRLRTFFIMVSQQEIDEAETIMKERFPEELTDFFLNVGSGWIRATIDDPYRNSDHFMNRVFDPLTIANMKNDRVDLFGGPELKKNQLPIMEIVDHDYFVVRTDLPQCPVHIRGTSNIIVEDSFENFIYNLTHKDIAYYEDRVNQQFKQRKSK